LYAWRFPGTWYKLLSGVTTTGFTNFRVTTWNATGTTKNTLKTYIVTAYLSSSTG